MVNRFLRAVVARGMAVALALCLSSAVALEIGTRSLLVAESAPMKSLTLAPTAASFTRFAVKVGGVAFTTTASGTDGSRIVGVRYQPSMVDGSRFVLELARGDGARIVAALPAKDWVALPIARFVDTDDHGAVTLFGSLKNEAEERRYRSEMHAMIANYHPAVQDTLIGLRLLQADMMLIEEQADDIFKDAGRYLLGAGEKAPTANDLKANAERRAAVSNWQKAQPRKPDSYIVGDIDSKITFSMRDGKLVLAGDPTWACWHRDSRAVLATTNSMTDKLSADAYLLYVSIDDIYERMMKATDDVTSPSNQVGDQIAKMRRIFEVRWATTEGIARQALRRTGKGRAQPASFSPTELRAALVANDQQKVEKIVSKALENVHEIVGGSPLGNQIEQEVIAVAPSIEKQIESLDVIQMQKYSATLSKLLKDQQGINPIVYESLTTSVRLAAVLRAAKLADPTGYAKLMASINGLRSNGVVQPSGYQLRTPAVYPRD